MEDIEQRQAVTIVKIDNGYVVYFPDGEKFCLTSKDALDLAQEKLKSFTVRLVENEQEG